MTYTIAIAGKGGTGKTTFTGLLIDSLTKTKNNTLLAVDADANANLNEVLGITFDKCVADIRESTLRQVPGYESMPKDRLIEYLLNQTLVENELYDLLVMGRPEGKRCYCYVNNLLRRHLDEISKNYDYIVIDNEAGMEHLSRMTTRDVNLLVIISDPSLRGLRTAVRIEKLVEELSIPVEQQILVINKVRTDSKLNIIQQARGLGFQKVLILPENDDVRISDENGIPLVSLSSENSLKKTILEFIQRVNKGEFVFEKIESQQTLVR